MVSQGRSWSGHERNRAFLNLGENSSSFANVSAVSGLDFEDDARAIAVLDWDGDGDLDLWLRNRNAPQLRLMRNEMESGGNRFLRLRLRGDGKTTNRDAIGARVEIKLKGESKPLVRTVRAGEGFLSQSSKVLHFGLGTEGEIEKVVIRWPNPDGLVQELVPRLALNKTYLVAQGAEARVESEGFRDELSLSPMPVELPAEAGGIRVFAQSLFPWPGVLYRDFEGVEQETVHTEGRWLLVNLWATWCAPCRGELSELAQRSEELDEAGIDVVALSVDMPEGFSKENPVISAAETVLDDLEFPYGGGFIEAEQIANLQMIHDFMTSLNQDIPVPTSFLISRRKQVVAIYKGVVSVDQLVRDASEPAPALEERLMQLTRLDGSLVNDEAVRQAGVDREAGFQEREARVQLQHSLFNSAAFFAESLRHRPDSPKTRLELAANMVDMDLLAGAYEHLRQILSDEGSREYHGAAMYQLSIIALKQGDLANTFAFLEETLELQPDHAMALNNLAYLMVTQLEETNERNERAVALAERAVGLSGRQQINFLDTLASVYGAVERYEDAIAVIEEALPLALDSKNAPLVEKLRAKRADLARQMAVPGR